VRDSEEAAARKAEHEAEKRAAGEGESAPAGVGLNEAHIRALLEKLPSEKRSGLRKVSAPSSARLTDWRKSGRLLHGLSGVDVSL
jgi:sirohydrochlorin ferrochelatase